MWHFIRWNRLLGEIAVNWDFLKKPIWNRCRYCTKSCMLTVYGSHTLLQIPSHFTQFLTKNDQNSTWKSLHVSHNIVFGEICHKYIHMMGWKDQTSKEIVTCQNSISLSSCCEQAAAGMIRVFPVHFVHTLWHAWFMCSYRKLHQECIWHRFYCRLMCRIF